MNGSDPASRHTPPERPSPARRSLLRTTAWATPVAAASFAAPAYAASQQDQLFGMLFDGGLAANGTFNRSYLNFGMASNSSAPFTLAQNVTVIFSVVGLLSNASGERSYSTSTNVGALDRGQYNASTQTSEFRWVIPAGVSIPSLSTGASIPQVHFTWGDGVQGVRRVTNKIVVQSVAGALVTQINGSVGTTLQIPADSQVWGDFVKSHISPDGIY